MEKALNHGMTEAAHQVASNPLPPLPHKSGTVGTGGEIAVIDDKGHHLRANSSGEVIVRGPNLMSGDYKDDATNPAAFIEGWFEQVTWVCWTKMGTFGWMAELKSSSIAAERKLRPPKSKASCCSIPPSWRLQFSECRTRSTAKRSVQR